MTLAQQFYERFRALDKVYGRYDITGTNGDSPKMKGKAKTLQETATESHWNDHLEGKVGIGLVPIREDNTCLWGALDIDKYDLNLEEVSKRIDEKDLPVILLRTKSGGAHIYLFCREAVSARIMRDKLKIIELALGFKNSEIFPKQETLGPQDYGSWINMPYFDLADNKRFAIVNGKALTAEEFLDHADDIALTKAELRDYSPQISSNGEFDGAPPCLLYYIEHGFPDGSRNNALFSMGVLARKKYPEGWEEHVHEYNRRFMGPGTYQEVETIIKSLRKKGYTYKCKDQPLAPICNKQECINCTYGIIDPKQERENRPCVLDSVDRPVIKCEAPPGSNDDPYYVFKIAGKAMELTPDAILDQSRFIRKYFTTFDRIILRVTDMRWEKAMNELLEEKIIEVMAPDAGPEGQLMTLVEYFCTGKIQARAKEELLLGKPWTDEHRTYFCSKDLFKFLTQQGFRAYKEKELYPIFRRYGLMHHKFNIKGKCIGAWSLPEYSTQTEDFDKVHFEEEAPF